MVLGTAEGGKKITLYNVNDLNIKKINIEKLNEYYFETMHHEFAHILHQKRNFDPSFNRISEGKYVGADWYYYMTAQGAMPRTDDVAWSDGFVTAYAMSQSNEDFVENIAMYVTHTQAYWDNMMTQPENRALPSSTRNSRLSITICATHGGSTSTNFVKSCCAASRRLPKLT